VEKGFQEEHPHGTLCYHPRPGGMGTALKALKHCPFIIATSDRLGHPMAVATWKPHGVCPSSVSTVVGPGVQPARHKACCCPVRDDTGHRPQLAGWPEALGILLSPPKFIFKTLAPI